MYTKGPVPETGAAWSCALELAESLNDTTFQLTALWGLSFYRALSSEHRSELALAQRFCSLAANRTDLADVHVGDRMIGAALHYLGDQVNARDHTERVLPFLDRIRLYRFQFNQASAARCIWRMSCGFRASRSRPSEPRKTA
jgi:hypothetical protein